MSHILMLTLRCEIQQVPSVKGHFVPVFSDLSYSWQPLGSVSASKREADDEHNYKMLWRKCKKGISNSAEKLRTNKQTKKKSIVWSTKRLG